MPIPLLALGAILPALAGGTSERPDALTRARQAVLGEARLPWLLQASGSITQANGSTTRFLLDWEPCGSRLDLRPSSLAASKALTGAASLLCAPSEPTAVTERSAQKVRIEFEKPARAMIDVDPDTGFITWAHFDDRPGVPPGQEALRPCPFFSTATVSLSDYRRVGGAALPHRLSVRWSCERGTEEWTIEQIEILPLP